MAERIISGTLMDEFTTITYIDVCREFDISEKEIEELVLNGILDLNLASLKQNNFSSSALVRMQTALRLKHDLDLNYAGIALALDLLDKVNQLQQELEILRDLAPTR